jgi:hypothetical protein
LPYRNAVTDWEKATSVKITNLAVALQLYDAPSATYVWLDSLPLVSKLPAIPSAAHVRLDGKDIKAIAGGGHD